MEAAQRSVWVPSSRSHRVMFTTWEIRQVLDRWTSGRRDEGTLQNAAAGDMQEPGMFCGFLLICSTLAQSGTWTEAGWGQNGSVQ